MTAFAPPLSRGLRIDDDASAGARALATEWLETDGLGGYASGTAADVPTRRYHGLLVSRLAGQSRRHVLLSRFVEEVDGRSAEPRSFTARPFPTTEREAGGVAWRREVLLVRGSRIALVRWTVLEAPGPVDVALRPFLPCRGADDLTIWNEVLREDVEPFERGLSVRPYEALPAVSLTWDRPDASFVPAPAWERGLTFVRDEERGYGGAEDQWSPGELRARLSPGESLVLAATPDEAVSDPSALWEVESEVRREEAADEPADRAAVAADAFLYRDDRDRPGVVAGYPWFGEWGRDTFIALPGLTLARGDAAGSAEVLEGALPYLRNGLLPNVFGEAPEASHYGSVDASLWYARAVRLWSKASADRARLLDVFRPALTEIAEGYAAGTGLGVHVDEDGGLVAGGPELNATWMDASTEDGPVTPRAGCAVELNALWYQLLETLEDLALLAGDRAAKKRWTAERRRVKRTFLERFWLEDEQRLADVWSDGEVDRALRPNMVLAAALDASPLKRAQRAGVFDAARRELLTPFGLRTLAPGDPAYRGRFEGGPRERDGAYHQGTVWPWLLGSYTELGLRAHGTKRAWRDELRGLWRTLEAHLDDTGLGHFSEVFDGDEPQRPGGTIAQAWNTAEYLRARALLASSRL